MKVNILRFYTVNFSLRSCYRRYWNSTARATEALLANDMRTRAAGAQIPLSDGIVSSSHESRHRVSTAMGYSRGHFMSRIIIWCKSSMTYAHGTITSRLD